MAQRFADWYYAISTSRLGEARGTDPCRASCKRFGDGIVQVSDPKVLIPWAHKILGEEMKNAGHRAEDGNEPSAYTAQQRPKDLLEVARRSLPNEINELEQLYNGKSTNTTPMALLKARNDVKRWLRANAQVPFKVVPEEPNPDRAPITHYESGLLEGSRSQIKFERWMLSDVEICQDIAEFAPFAIALRGGMPAETATQASAPPAPSSGSKAAQTTPRSEVETPPALPSNEDEPFIGAQGPTTITVTVMAIGAIAVVALIATLWWMYV